MGGALSRPIGGMLICGWKKGMPPGMPSGGSPICGPAMCGAIWCMPIDGEDPGMPICGPIIGIPMRSCEGSVLIEGPMGGGTYEGVPCTKEGCAGGGT
mmetsp:Transcript_95844/g.254577  ORF Transcript_95844/g.254577 Transcript_95844/m.254577 type:complete len:98 (+) Transcript_95844:387-680(+)